MYREPPRPNPEPDMRNRRRCAVRLFNACEPFETATALLAPSRIPWNWLNAPSWESMRANGGFRETLNLPPQDLGDVVR